MRNNLRTTGLTLIELLTVISIIMILAGMIMVAGPRIRERAQIAKLTNTCNQIRTACVGYATQKVSNSIDTFPPAYGFKKLGADPNDPNEANRFYLEPYMSRLKMFRSFEYYDLFAQMSHDTDNDGLLSPLSFLAPGTQVGSDNYSFGAPLYRENNLAEIVSKLVTEQRPLAYIPVNLDQARKTIDYYYKLQNTAGREKDGEYALCWLSLEPLAGGNPLGKPGATTFPPNKYDDFVLISVGPGNNTGGLLTPPGSKVPGDRFMQDLLQVTPNDWYHILALRAYFLATRDLNQNGQFDFDMRSRTRSNAGDKGYLLPDGTAGFGPLIYKP